MEKHLVINPQPKPLVIPAGCCMSYVKLKAEISLNVVKEVGVGDGNELD